MFVLSVGVVVAVVAAAAAAAAAAVVVVVVAVAGVLVRCPSGYGLSPTRFSSLSTL